MSFYKILFSVLKRKINFILSMNKIFWFALNLQIPTYGYDLCTRPDSGSSLTNVASIFHDDLIEFIVHVRYVWPCCSKCWTLSLTWTWITYIYSRFIVDEMTLMFQWKFIESRIITISIKCSEKLQWLA